MRKANISWIVDRLATGGDFAFLPEVMEAQLEDLLTQDITLIIDCREEAADSELWAAVKKAWDGAPSYLTLPTEDIEGWSIPDSHFDAAVKAAMPVLWEGKRVFVHCHMGVNRGPSTAFALLLELDPTMSAEDAYLLIREKRPEAAVYYADDALRAHLRRHGVSEYTVARQVEAFERFLGAHLAEHGELIQHQMRESHASDKRQIEEGRM